MRFPWDAGRRGQWITSGAQLALLVFVLQVEVASARITLLGLMASFSLLAWLAALRRRRAILDTPTARIASAAQGQVELLGRGLPLDGIPVCSPLTGLTCLWFRYTLEEADSEGHWRIIDQGESDASFLLDDGSGRCLVDPEGGEILTRHKEVQRNGKRRHTEWRLLPGDTLYVNGAFKTLNGSATRADADATLKALLAEWKADRAELLRRFDMDGNGEIDQEEWQLARAAARREAARQLAENDSPGELHILRRPENGAPLLISNLPPERLARRYGLWALFHLLVFFGSLVLIARIAAKAAAGA